MGISEYLISSRHQLRSVIKHIEIGFSLTILDLD